MSALARPRLVAPPSALQLRLHGVGVQFGRKQALQDIDLSIHAGERVALVGANGSGKSTLLRVLHGLQAPSRGQREVARHDDGRALRQAMVFQRPFMLRLPARINIELGLWLAGVPREERAERARQALHRVGLSDQSGRNARVLSGGQQQRLALARAWALRPDVLFLDEPTASLDPTAKREVEALIEEFAGQGITVVMSSHNLGQVKRLARRVIYLEQGRLVSDVDVDHFFHGELPVEARQFLKGELPWV